ncbi:methylglyoxal reductase (NADPH-dependent) gre2 [Coniochaeta pulveracea]|uniref:Methylglyoxal reductase (NADPH-dependent) gre2 n=1 Tax=Coniochaeta pulveracea TaxID=177199 RepID=A0A420Y9Z3_9PEZI|nr:methylglyoxal reductase (NADPH-dependent) gre2 [Coniochaeta pulveracea]
MTKVLLTGGSGFIAAHILEQLLQKGHNVVTTVRSEEKAQKIREAHPDKNEDQLKVVVTGDIAKPDAFDEVVKTPGIEVVLHTASPFHFNWKDPKTELVDPAVNGTTGILKAIARSAPQVRRVVVTSSFAAILTEEKTSDPNTTFSEKSWNPVTEQDMHRNPPTAYRVSKTLAEKAAWDFVKDPANNAKFDLATINPPMVFGPVVHYLASLDSINTSNERIVQLVQGKWKNQIPDTGAASIWIDVRDVATAHVKAGLEVPEAGGHRLFTFSSRFSNRDIADVVKKNFPEYQDKLPGDDVKGGELAPEDKRYKVDNSETNSILKIDWIPLEKTIVDTVKSLKSYGA